MKRVSHGYVPKRPQMRTLNRPRLRVQLRRKDSELLLVTSCYAKSPLVAAMDGALNAEEYLRAEGLLEKH